MAQFFGQLASPFSIMMLICPTFLLEFDSWKMLCLQIASLTLMKDHERLDLLKEIGGTRVYEERRKESLKIMVDTGNQCVLDDH